MKIRAGRIARVMLAAVVLYAAYAVWSGVDKVGDNLARFRWQYFAAACGLAFGNYLVRFFKWEFYLAKLEIRHVGKLDSLLTFFSGFVLTVTPGKVGEMFKSIVLSETHDVPAPKTAPIVIAERVTDVFGIVVLIVLGSFGFKDGLWLAGLGGALVLMLLAFIASKRLSHGVIGIVECCKAASVFRTCHPRPKRESHRGTVVRRSRRRLQVRGRYESSWSQDRRILRACCMPWKSLLSRPRFTVWRNGRA